jgi:uncharacterized protein YjhX (UPF0386 family)
VAWAVTHLKKGKALESTATGIYRITERGKALLKTDLEKITVKGLT